MSDGGASEASWAGNERDWWSRHFGDRGILQLIIGNNALFLVVVIATCAMAYVIAFKEHYDLLGIFMKFLFLVVILDFLFKLVNLLITRRRTIE